MIDHRRAKKPQPTIEKPPSRKRKETRVFFLQNKKRGPKTTSKQRARKRNHLRALRKNGKGKKDHARIVCLCGSTRFGDAFTKALREETLAGKIVLTIGCMTRPDGVILDEIEGRLDELNKLAERKIDLADEILVLNVDGYVGTRTRGEIVYALKTDKHVRWLEPDKIPEFARR